MGSIQKEEGPISRLLRTPFSHVLKLPRQAHVNLGTFISYQAHTLHNLLSSVKYVANTVTLYRLSRESPLLQNTFVSLSVSPISPTIPLWFPMIPSCFLYDSPGVFLGSWLVPSRFPSVPILDSTLNKYRSSCSQVFFRTVAMKNFEMFQETLLAEDCKFSEGFV